MYTKNGEKDLDFSVFLDYASPCEEVLTQQRQSQHCLFQPDHERQVYRRTKK